MMMKTRKIIALLIVVAILSSLSACKKNRYCHCIGESYEKVRDDGDTILFADTIVVNIDRSMKCESISEMGFEKQQEGVPVTSTRKFDCKELDMDTVVTIPQEHPVDD